MYVGVHVGLGMQKAQLLVHSSFREAKPLPTSTAMAEGGKGTPERTELPGSTHS